MTELINNINYLDLIYFFTFLVMIYLGSKTGVGAQLLSLVGFVVMLFLAITYYDEVSKSVLGLVLKQKWARPLAFLSIAVIIFIIISALERFFNITGGEGMAFIEKVGGVLIAAIRAFMVFGLIALCVLLVPLKEADVAFNESRSAMGFVNFDLKIYSWLTERVDFVDDRGKDEVLTEFLSSPIEAKKKIKKEGEK